jgi:hypothetical protein
MKQSSKLRLLEVESRLKRERVYLEKPLKNNILNFLNVVKKLPEVIKEHQTIKNYTSKDIEMINRLNTTAIKKLQAKHNNSKAKSMALKSLSENPK